MFIRFCRDVRFGLSVAMLGALCISLADAQTCDNQCRMRNKHLSSNGNCIHYTALTCLHCAPGFNVRCKPETGDNSLTTNCAMDGTQIVFWEATDCVYVCPIGTYATVEADLGDDTTVFHTIDRYVCKAPPIVYDVPLP